MATVTSPMAARNLPSTTSQSVSGKLINISRVFCMRSSENSRMVTAGQKKQKSSGAKPK